MTQKFNSSGRLKRVAVWLDQESILTLQVLRDKLSLSTSAILRQALREYLSLPETKEIAKRLQQVAENFLTEVKIFEEHRIPEIKSELKELTYQVKQLNFRLDKLTEALEVVAFWGALVSELIKVRLFNTKSLSPEEYEKFKNMWQGAHEAADVRIENLLGKRVWNKKFNPEKNPLEK